MQKLKTALSRLKNRKVFLAVFLGLIPLIATAIGLPLPGSFEGIVTGISGILVLLGILEDPNSESFLEDKDGDGVPDFIDRK